MLARTRLARLPAPVCQFARRYTIAPKDAPHPQAGANENMRENNNVNQKASTNAYFYYLIPALILGGGVTYYSAMSSTKDVAESQKLDKAPKDVQAAHTAAIRKAEYDEATRKTEEIKGRA